jgi:hypothetical protein
MTTIRIEIKGRKAAGIVFTERGAGEAISR